MEEASEEMEEEMDEEAVWENATEAEVVAR